MRETQNSKCSVPSFIISYCVWSKGIHPRHPPREFPLGLRAPVLGSRLFAERLKWEEMSRSSKSPLLVGERMLLSPARCLGSCSLTVAFRRAEQGSPHPAAPTPLSFFMSVFSVSLSLRTYELHIAQALVFSP